MKKLLLATWILLGLGLGMVNAQILSQFTWDGTSDERIASIGPNATSSGSVAEAQPTGNGTPQGLAPGCAQVLFGNCVTRQNANLVLPNTGGYFDVPEVRFAIDYRRTDGETEAWFFSRDEDTPGGAKFHFGLQFAKFKVEYATDNGFGGTDVHDMTLFGYWGGGNPDDVPNDGSWHRYEWVYTQSTGTAQIYIDGALALTQNTAVPGQPLLWPSDLLVISETTDNNGVDLAIFDNAEVSIPTPLPVTYNFFTGEQVGVRNRIVWETANEANSSHFNVLRATDDEFVEIGKMNAAGFSDDPVTYEIYDPNPQPGANFYRLEQVDLDGKTSYSSMIEVNFELKETGLVGVYPNPVDRSGSLNVKFNATGEKRLTISVMDLQGRMLVHETHELVTEVSNFEVPAHNLPEGLYIVRVVAGGKSYTEKVMVR